MDHDHHEQITAKYSVSSMRTLLFAVSLLIVVFAIYGYVMSSITNSGVIISTHISKAMSSLGLAVFLFFIASLFIIGYSIYRICLYQKRTKRKIILLHSDIKKRDPLIVLPIILVNIISQSKRYQQLFLIVLLAYAILFAFVSQIIIFRPDVSFSQIYRISTPSWIITPCCNLPGLVPTFTAYLSDHIVVYIIPIDLLLDLILSTLVSINMTLAVFIFKNNKPKNSNNNNPYFSGIAAGTGLFTACPTCAGTFFSTLAGLVIGTSSSTFSSAAVRITTTAALTPFQILFIIISISILLVSPYLAIKKSKEEICQ
jgi:hypothetical protein